MIELSFNDIASRIKSAELDNYDLVVGIKEGGAISAALVSYKLNCDLCFVKVSRRNEDNEIIYDPPRTEGSERVNNTAQNVLIVDDVSVTGKTLDTVKDMFKGRKVATLVLKGKGDHVLFPEIEECVNWPWR